MSDPVEIFPDFAVEKCGAVLPFLGSARLIMYRLGTYAVFNLLDDPAILALVFC